MFERRARSQRSDFDLTLYLVVSGDDVEARDLIQVVDAAVRGGVTLVQLREKTAPRETVVARARALKDLLGPQDIPLIINDDLEVALEVDAAGVHLGQDDMAPPAARAALGPDKILGYSAGNAEEAARVDPTVVDYAGIGPVYATGSKADAGAAIGLEGLSDLRMRLDLPLVAIGGITADTAAAVMTTGVDGIAVVSAICGASDLEAAARALRNAVEGARS